MTTIADSGAPGAAPGAAPSPTAAGRRQRQIVTPEGVALTLEIADRGSRAAAFILDLVFILIAMIAGGIALLVLSDLMKTWSLVVAILGFFLLRIFYFPVAELYWRGATPGKRILGLKVIDRAGGPLRPDAVVVRNLMREVEVFLPLTLLMMHQQTGFGGLVQLLIVTWIGIFTLMPLFNRDGLRVGDLVAGTMVIMAPKAALLPDLAGRPVRTRVPLTVTPDSALDSGPDSRGSRYRFTPAQLGVYGVYELQTLEAVLRRNEAGSIAGRIEIARRIRAKIGWPDGSQGDGTGRFDEAGFDASAFLEAFYAAQRAHLERRLLYGHRRRDKHDKA
jgi:uncharacterized RDD family membrane protein YckC